MMAMGDVGIYSPFSLDQNSLSVEKVEASKAPWSPLRFEMPLVRIDSTQQNLPTAMTYVFFNVPTHLVKQMGEALSIWFRQNNGDWQRCNTTFIVDQAAFNRATSQSGSNASGVVSGNATGNSLDNGRTRVACVAPLYNTIYGIGSIMEK